MYPHSVAFVIELQLGGAEVGGLPQVAPTVVQFEAGQPSLEGIVIDLPIHALLLQLFMLHVFVAGVTVGLVAGFVHLHVAYIPEPVQLVWTKPEQQLVP